VVFTFVVQNVGPEEVTLTTLSDSVFGDLNGQGNCVTGGVIPVGGSYSCSITMFLASDSLTAHYNVITAVGTDDDGSTDTDTDDETVTFTDVLPDIEVIKSADPTSVPETGGEVTFTYEVTNKSLEPVTITTLYDDIFGTLAGDADCQVGTVLAAYASCEFSVVRTISGIFGGPDHVNVFSAKAEDNDGNEVGASDDAVVTFTDVTFTLALTKTVEQSSYSQVGEVLTYELVVENTGNGTLTNVMITDPKLGDLVCQPAQPATLLPGETMTCLGDYVVTQEDIDEGEVENTATATSNESEPDEDDAEVPAVVTPGLSIIKEGDAGPVTIGDMVHYTITVKNTGNVTLHDVVVTDITLAFSQSVGTLALGQEVKLNATYGPISESDLPGPVVNTAIVVGKTPEDEPVGPEEDSHEVPLVATPKLVLVKTASPTLYSEVGETINYSYKLTNMGNVTLYTPFTVSDTKATVTCPPTPVSLAPGESIVCTASYVITDVDLEAGSVTNIAEGKAKGPQGEDVTSNKDEETVVYVPLPATLGDRVWLDKNHNGVQDADEVGVAGVKVDLYAEGGALVATTTTDAAGNYLFTPLASGGYTVEFTAPDGYRFTLHDASNNSLDATDSDPLVPNLEVTVSDGGVEPELGGPLSYTFYYTNSDPVLAASGVVITARIPEGTSYLATGSTPGWTCTNVEAGGFCKFTLPTLAADSSGSVTFVVLLKGTDSEVPDQLDMLVTITQSTVGRTPVIVLAAGEDNRTVDAGIFTTELSSWQTPTPTEPTNLPVDEQPDVSEQQHIYLPVLALDKK
jgi:hypothetical protein